MSIALTVIKIRLDNMQFPATLFPTAHSNFVNKGMQAKGGIVVGVEKFHSKLTVTNYDVRSA